MTNSRVSAILNQSGCWEAAFYDIQVDQNLILLFFHRSNTGIDPGQVAERAKASGIAILGVGVGASLDKNKIIPLTSSPEPEFYFPVSDFFALSAKLDDILTAAFPQAESIIVAGVVDSKFPPITNVVSLVGTIAQPTDHSFEWRVGALAKNSTLQMHFDIKVPCSALTGGQYSVRDGRTSPFTSSALEKLACGVNIRFQST
jgi:hypothetical protein